jgi:hypothetical protein
MLFLGAFRQPDGSACDCTEPPIPTRAIEASTKAVSNDFGIFFTPCFAGVQLAAHLRAHGFAANIAARFFTLRKNAETPPGARARHVIATQAKVTVRAGWS